MLLLMMMKVVVVVVVVGRSGSECTGVMGVACLTRPCSVHTCAPRERLLRGGEPHVDPCTCDLALWALGARLCRCAPRPVPFELQGQVT